MSTRSWFAQPHLPGGAWVQDGLTGRTPTSFSSRPALCPSGCRSPRSGGRWGVPALRGLRPRSRLLYWSLVAHRTGLLASEDFPISRGVGRQLTLRRWVGGHSDVGRIPHFSTKEGEREKKWVTRAQSLAEVGAEQGLARRGSLGGSGTETCLSGAPQVSAGCSLVSSAPRLSQGSSLWHVLRHLRLAFPKEA